VTESSKVHTVSATLTSVKIDRNRLMSWDSPVRGLTKPGEVIPSSKTSTTLKLLGFVSKTPMLIFASLSKLPYALFKLGYEIAKLVTRALSNIRRLLFMPK
jgi:hypothetical protein